MTAYLSYEANLARLDDLRRRADERRAPRRDARRSGRASNRCRTRTDADVIAIRRATDADRPALARLAALDSARPLSGEVLIAEVAGTPQAALEIAGGATIADPFRPTEQLVELLGLRAARLHQTSISSRRESIRRRWASRTA